LLDAARGLPEPRGENRLRKCRHCGEGSRGVRRDGPRDVSADTVKGNQMLQGEGLGALEAKSV
jgi:hypothetical protein